ncbi:two-component sensor histidine kinase [Nocardia uniformis]|uniref:histidine kinase n=1 Tax=Nocardia uniformis TaxID=53432 RepID=A0A849BVV1_9NOCA|nr:histidine kinase [Nocardia uniformis]NNH69086.1 two-component sensor histidine kinase [Nocardia uniformis]
MRRQVAAGRRVRGDPRARAAVSVRAGTTAGPEPSSVDAAGRAADRVQRPVVRDRIADAALVIVTGAVDLAFWSGDRDLIGGGVLPLWVVPAAAAALCAVLLLRHRFPLGVWVLAWLYTSVNLFVPEYYPFAYLLVASYAVATRVPGPTARLVLIAAALPLGLFGYRTAQSAAPEAQLRDFATAAASWAIILSIAWGLGRLAHAREQHARAERERLAAEAEKALAAQRLRLAHELHDSVSGAVAGMILHAGAARAVCGGADPRVRQALEVIEQAGAQAMTELHSMLGLLRSTVPADPPAARFADIERLLESARNAGLDIRVDRTGTARPLSPAADLAAYRIVQESLTNVIKHAGRGAAVTLVIDWTDRALDLTVRSRGGQPTPAPATLSSGMGLRGLRERLDVLGGELTGGPDNDGWRVHATVPAATTAPMELS